jgi:glucose/arabinose dehydrogenase
MIVEEHGNHLELVAGNLSFPTSLTFDTEGVAYVAEAGLPFGGAPPGGSVWRIAPHGERALLIEGLRPPVNGLTFHGGSLYVSEGGHPGRITRYGLNGDQQAVILDNLPGPGNYHTNMVAFGPDGKLYFSQGAMTNSGIVGLDAYELGWLRRLPHAHDVPGYDLVLSGVNFETADPRRDDPGARVLTGAFSPFGTPTEPGQHVEGRLPCTAGIMRCNLDGSDLELVAWGLRNAYGIGFLPSGELLVIDQGADDRGSRPIGNAPDLLFEIHSGAWYGWPDFIGGEPVIDPQYRPERGPALSFVLANHADFPPPQRPLLRFPAHAAAVKFDVIPSNAALWGGQIIVALFGDERPMTAPPGPPAGRAIARIDPSDWSLHAIGAGPLDRPIDVRLNPVDGCLYVLDFGRFEMRPERGMDAEPQSGRLWRLRPGGPSPQLR